MDGFHKTMASTCRLDVTFVSLLVGQRAVIHKSASFASLSKNTRLSHLSDEVTMSISVSISSGCYFSSLSYVRPVCFWDICHVEVLCSKGKNGCPLLPLLTLVSGWAGWDYEDDLPLVVTKRTRAIG
jgi:hypothetical protein